MTIYDALATYHEARRTHSVVAQDQQGIWRKITNAQQDGFVLYVYCPDLNIWFVPQQWELRERTRDGFRKL